MHLSPARSAASIALALALCSTCARAALPPVDVSGFGTGGFAITDNGKAEFGRAQPQTVGANTQGDIGVDSLLALQGTVHLNDMFSATVQAMVRRTFNPGFQLDIPVFFVKAELTHDLAVRVGRIQLPTFMISDYRQVGYSNTFVRPPIEVYGQIPFDGDDGADVLYRKAIGPVDFSAQGFYGKTDANLAGVSIQSRKNWGVNANVTVGPLTLRVGRSQSKFTSRSASVTQLLTAVNAAGFTALANQLNPLNVPFKFTDYGFSLDETHLTIQGEVSKTTAGGFVQSTDGQYLLVGYRIHKFTPFAMYARQKVTSARTDPTIPRLGPLLPLALGVDQLINSVGADQRTISAGLRWDVHESVDLKMQIDRVSPQGNGLFFNIRPGFHGPVNVASMTLDFVF